VPVTHLCLQCKVVISLNHSPFALLPAWGSNPQHLWIHGGKTCVHPTTLCTNRALAAEHSSAVTCTMFELPCRRTASNLMLKLPRKAMLRICLPFSKTLQANCYAGQICLPFSKTLQDTARQVTCRSMGGVSTEYGRREHCHVCLCSLFRVKPA
jgi:hypothetical protein